VRELEHVVNKFVYHRDLNLTHGVSVEGTTVKINRFKVIEKKKETGERTASPNRGTKLGTLKKQR
jgi:hypothetical protein